MTLWNFSDTVSPLNSRVINVQPQFLISSTTAEFLFSNMSASELLRALTDVSIAIEQGSEEDYLAVLTSSVKGGQKEALRRLTTIRLALAQYFARCPLDTYPAVSHPRPPLAISV